MGQPLPILTPLQKPVDPEVLFAAVEASHEGMALAENGVICCANRAFARVLGHQNPNALVGRPLSRLRPPNYPCACMHDGEPHGPDEHHLCQFVTERRDGTPFRIESSCSRFQAQGRDFLLVSIRDVTLLERRRVVRDGDRRFRAIFDGAPMGIVQCDLTGKVLKTNPAIERMLGYSRQELRGMHFRDFTHSDDFERDLQLFQELVQGERDSYELELRYVTKTRHTGWVRLVVSLVRGIDGRPQFAIGMTEEVTERKQAEERLRQAQKMEVVGRLVGGVSHDFNNLLTGIMLYCDLLIAGLDRGSRLLHHAEEIRMAGEQGAALIQQLLALSRQQVIEPRILCLNEVILGTKNLLSRLLGDKFEMATELKDPLGNVKIDPAQVQQILFNLVLNARDAMPEGGRILVETRNDKLDSARLAVTLTVTDHGCGMSAETRSRLYEPFFTTKSNGRGTGLGLATVHDIVTNNGGTIEVNSELGRGTEFSVSLPRVPDPASRVVEARHSPGAVGETILLVEDNLTVRQAARRILSECGYVVLEAGSGVEAIEVSRLHEGEIHLLLADIVMPGMSGREVARQLCADRPELRVLYMSGFEPDATSANVGDGSVVSFRKPFTGAALLDKLRQTLESDRPKSSKKSAKRKREQP